MNNNKKNDVVLRIEEALGGSKKSGDKCLIGR